MRERGIESRRLKVLAFCLLLGVSCLVPKVEAVKTKSRSKSSSSSSSSGRVSKPSSTSYSNPGSLSYNNYQAKPAPAKPAPKPSAPVDTSNQRNIGWNVNNQAKPAGSVAQPAVNKPPYPVQSNAAKPPYPVQATHNTHQTHSAPGAPPPPYSHGPPPPYSAVNNPNMNSRFNEQPPMYSPGNQGFRPGQPGFGQPGSYGQPGGFGQPMGGYHPPATGFGAPHGTFQGGGFAPPVNYAPAPSFPVAAIPVGAYKPQSSGIGVGGIAAGIGTGLLAGAAGSALYNALRPEDRGRYRENGVTIINNHAPAAPATPAAGTTLAEGAAPAPVQASGVAAVPNAPPASGTNGQSAVPLAPMSGAADNSNPMSQAPVQTAPAETTTVDPNAKQYIPPPGQYYPATGQYVPPGEYDPTTGIFTPGRYIPETNIFQSGLYDPLSQMFTPGRYDANGQFIPDAEHPPLSLAPNNSAVQPETVTPVAASQYKTTSGATMQTISLLTALGALIFSGSFRVIYCF
ncbi:collagen alpha-1(X) chain-like [Anopheles marshallii]|uniref:collagen alpha-1(X) chain-like n=1 Tax=Anopheles marshallii TaxID=1521116 RepID=UPI00237A4FB6|nr:collagen alpha-1(X) chain-like [Anopheles marshallii]